MSVSVAVARSDVIRVLVVDDSSVVRGLIAKELNAHPDIRVAAVAANGDMALLQLRTTPVDVVVLDIEMPIMDGLTALPRILADHPGVKVVMASTLTRRNAEISLKALSLGASDYVAKPEAGLASAEDFKRDLVSKVRALGKGASTPSTRASSAVKPAPWRKRVTPQAIFIGSSTGGPVALSKLFESLRGGVSQPIFIAQHMPATFTAMLAEQLGRISGRPCAEGRDGEPVLAAHIYVAPGGKHMIVEGTAANAVIRLNEDPPVNYCRPAVDPLFESAARVFGERATALVLTGMGADGAKGCEAIAAAGGRFVAQDEASSVVWGMPGAAARTGLAEEILPIDSIGPWLRRVSGAAS